MNSDIRRALIRQAAWVLCAIGALFALQCYTHLQVVHNRSVTVELRRAHDEARDRQDAADHQTHWLLRSILSRLPDKGGD